MPAAGTSGSPAVLRTGNEGVSDVRQSCPRAARADRMALDVSGVGSVGPGTHGTDNPDV
jgi:hypothetical protein